MKELGITRIFCTAEFSQREVDSDVASQRFESMREEMVALFKKHGFEYQCAETWLLSMQKYSVVNCHDCGNYMVDRTANPAGIENSSGHEDVICNGAVNEGRARCEDCLPHGHRWSVA